MNFLSTAGVCLSACLVAVVMSPVPLIYLPSRSAGSELPVIKFCVGAVSPSLELGQEDRQSVELPTSSTFSSVVAAVNFLSQQLPYVPSQLKGAESLSSTKNDSIRAPQRINQSSPGQLQGQLPFSDKSVLSCVASVFSGVLLC